VKDSFSELGDVLASSHLPSLKTRTGVNLHFWGFSLQNDEDK
jgi:hypothetical protein